MPPTPSESLLNSLNNQQFFVEWSKSNVKPGMNGNMFPQVFAPSIEIQEQSQSQLQSKLQALKNVHNQAQSFGTYKSEEKFTKTTKNKENNNQNSKQLQELNKYNNQLREQVLQQQRTIGDYMNEINSLNNQIDQLKKNFSVKEQKFQTEIKNERINLIQENEYLKSQYEKSHQKEDTINKEYGKLQITCKQKVEELNSVSNKNEKLKEEMIQLENQHEKTKIQLNSLKESNNKKDLQIKELKEKIQKGNRISYLFYNQNVIIMINKFCQIRVVINQNCFFRSIIQTTIMQTSLKIILV